MSELELEEYPEQRHIVEITHPGIKEMLGLPPGSEIELEYDRMTRSLKVLVDHKRLPKYDRPEGGVIKTIHIDELWNHLGVEPPQWYKEAVSE